MPSPIFVRLGEAENLIVCDSDRFTNTLGGGSGGALQAGAQKIIGGVGGLFAGGLSADPVDDEENAAFGIGVEPVFVIFAFATRVEMSPAQFWREITAICLSRFG